MRTNLSPLTADAFSKKLAWHGIDLLSGVFRGEVDAETQEICLLIESETGVDIDWAVANQLTENQWACLREFECEHYARILNYRKNADARHFTGDGLLPLARACDNTRTTTRNGVVVIGIFALVFIGYAAFFHNYNVNPQATRVIDVVLGWALGTLSFYLALHYIVGRNAGSIKSTYHPPHNQAQSTRGKEEQS